jgi:hypothetical protein
MNLLRKLIVPACLGWVLEIAVGVHAMAQDSSITTYGERNESAPEELDVFSFLIGKWEGSGKTHLPDGTVAEYDGLTWIGRYIFDGMAIADELHTPLPDGSPGMGITFRYFDPENEHWIVEFLNVSNSFIRRQVNAESGSVELDGTTVIVVSESDRSIIREYYRVLAGDRFDYSIDLSNDGGETWNRGSIEFTMSRVE